MNKFKRITIMIIVTGCGRSGTGYTCKVLTSAGYDFRHEKIGSDGTVDWYWGIKTPELNDIWVHQVRNPIKVIASNHAFIEKTWNFLYDNIPINRNQNILTRCCIYWLYWNKMVEPKCIKTYQVEKIESEWDELLSIFKLPHSDFPDMISKKTNRRNHLDLTWKDLYDNDKNLTTEIISLAKRYGYTIED